MLHRFDHHHPHHHHHHHHRHAGPRGFGRRGFEDGRGGEGRSRRVVDGGELRLLLLRLLADAPRHGYDLIRAIEERTGGGYAPSPGIVYPTLTMLQDMALIAQEPGGGNRRSYAVTPEGEAHLAERAEEVAAILRRLDAIGQAARRSDAGPVRRAMHNLRAALQGRLAADGVEPATLHDIAAILDDAAQRIERL